MTMQDDARQMIGFHVIASDDEDLGTVEKVYLDNRTHQPEFVSVKGGGLFGRHDSLVPLQGAHRSGERLRVPFDKQMVKDAPEVGNGDDISPEEGERLYRHYGLRSTDIPAQQKGEAGRMDRPGDRMGERTDATTGTGTAAGMDAQTSGAPSPTAFGDRTADDRRVAGDRPGEEAAGGEPGEVVVTRYEERMHVGTERQEAGHADVHKRVETENVERAVPVSHEELQVTREPITEDERMTPGTGADAGDDDEHRITLYSERPVVSTERVPVERVHISKTETQDQETVRGQIRKEHVDVDHDEDEGGAV